MKVRIKRGFTSRPLQRAEHLAHIIREPSKSFAKSVCALQTDRRWAVTGTPIQNRLSDLFSLFKFLQCYPFDDLKVFNSHVVQNWKARSDPECVARLKALVNCLSVRRPKTTIDLLPRKDDIERLDFKPHERQEYERAKTKTLSTIKDSTPHDQSNRGAVLLNALKWVNELRLICNHGIRTTNEMQVLKDDGPAWNARVAQARFDHLEGVGLAKCSEPSCGQDLSAALASEGDLEHDDEPWIGESLEIWCCSCSSNQVRKAFKAYKVCNHVPRRQSNPAILDDGSSQRPESDHAHSIEAGRLPTKIRRLIQDLMDTSEDIKR